MSVEYVNNINQSHEICAAILYSTLANQILAVYWCGAALAPSAWVERAIWRARFAWYLCKLLCFATLHRVQLLSRLEPLREPPANKAMIIMYGTLCSKTGIYLHN